MTISSGIAGTPPDLNAQVEQLAKMALQSGDHMGFFKQYLTPSNPQRLAAQLAQGIVQQQMQSAQTQQSLNQPQPPTVLDQMERQQQGMAGMPTERGMFDPSVYAQGGIGAGLGEEPQGQEQGQVQMARGGVVAFAGEGPSLVEGEPVSWGRLNPGSPLSQKEIDQIARERVAAERYKPMQPGEGFNTAETPEAKLARETRISGAQERIDSRTAAEARPAASEASRPGPTQPAEPPPAPNQAELKAAEKVTKLDGEIESAINKGKDPTKLIEQRRVLTEGIGAGRTPTVQASGIASPGPTTNATVRAVTPGAQAPTPPPAAAAAPAAPAAPGTPPPAAAVGAEEVAASAAKPGVVGRGLNAVGRGLGSLGRIAKFGLGAPLAAEVGWLGGQYIGNQLNEHTPIQEGIRGLMDRFGVTSSAEDRANESMQPGFIDNLVKQKQGTKAAGVDSLTGTIADSIAKQEGGGNFLSPEALGRANPENTSFGAIQLTGDALTKFVKEHKDTFGLTADPQKDPVAFAAQWKAAAEKYPEKMGAMQLKAFDTGYLTPTRTALTSVLPGKTDPRVLNYFTNRAVQLGAGSTARDKEAIAKTYNAADGDVESFLDNMNRYDSLNYEKHFPRESAKPDSDRNKYTRAKNDLRIAGRRDLALGTTPVERLVESGKRGIDTAKEIKEVVEQQPVVQGLYSLVGGATDKARKFTTDQLERLIPLNTGLEKPAAPEIVQDQHAEMLKNQQPAAQAPAAAQDDKIFGIDRGRLSNFLLQSGAAGLANPSQYASVSLGKGLQAGFTADQAREAKLAERTAKAEEKANDKAEKLYKDDLNLAIATRKSNPILNFDQNPELQTAIAKLGLLNTMAPSMRRRVGVDDAELKRLQQLVAALSKVAPAAGGKGQEPNPGWGQAVQGKG